MGERFLRADLALRLLAESRALQGRPMPEVRSVEANDDRVVIRLLAACPAPQWPWRVGHNGLTWTLGFDEIVADAGEGAAHPYPLLACIGEAEGYDVLVDLAGSPGLIAVGGHRRRARDLVLTIASELTDRAGAVQVVMVGFGDVPRESRDGRFRWVDSLDEVIPEAARLGAPNVVAAQLGLDDVFQGRQTHDLSAEIPTVVFLSGPPVPNRARLVAWLTEGTGASVVCVGDSQRARWRFLVDAAGVVDTGVLGLVVRARHANPSGIESLREAVRGRRGTAPGRSPAARDRTHRRRTVTLWVAGTTTVALVGVGAAVYARVGTDRNASAANAAATWTPTPSPTQAPSLAPSFAPSFAPSPTPTPTRTPVITVARATASPGVIRLVVRAGGSPVAIMVRLRTVDGESVDARRARIARDGKAGQVAVFFRDLDPGVYRWRVASPAGEPAHGRLRVPAPREVVVEPPQSEPSPSAPPKPPPASQAKQPPPDGPVPGNTTTPPSGPTP